MKFTPKTEKEIAEENLWQPGEYSFEVLEAADKTSKSGNEMIELKLKVYADDGGYIFLNDYLLESMAYKLRHAADACGILEQYNAGSLVAADFAGKAGRVKLVIQKSKDPQYSDKNAVKDYVKSSAETKASAPVNGVAQETPGKFIDETIPF